MVEWHEINCDLSKESTLSENLYQVSFDPSNYSSIWKMKIAADVLWLFVLRGSDILVAFEQILY